LLLLQPAIKQNICIHGTVFYATWRGIMEIRKGVLCAFRCGRMIQQRERRKKKREIKNGREKVAIPPAFINGITWLLAAHCFSWMFVDASWEMFTFSLVSTGNGGQQ
jgi:hypothetical protein